MDLYGVIITMLNQKTIIAIYSAATIAVYMLYKKTNNEARKEALKETLLLMITFPISMPIIISMLYS